MNILEYLRHMIDTSDGKILFLFILLNWCMILDWLSGTIVAYITKVADSKIGTYGILKKILVFLASLTLIFCSVIIPQGDLFIVGTLIGLIIMQLQSTVENFTRIDLKEGSFLTKVIKLFKKDSDN